MRLRLHCSQSAGSGHPCGDFGFKMFNEIRSIKTLVNSSEKRRIVRRPSSEPQVHRGLCLKASLLLGSPLGCPFRSPPTFDSLLLVHSLLHLNIYQLQISKHAILNSAPGSVSHTLNSCKTEPTRDRQHHNSTHSLRSTHVSTLPSSRHLRPHGRP